MSQASQGLYNQLAEGLLPSLVKAGLSPEDIIKEVLCAAGYFASQHDKEHIFLLHAEVAKTMFSKFKAEL